MNHNLSVLFDLIDIIIKYFSLQLLYVLSVQQLIIIILIIIT